MATKCGTIYLMLLCLLLSITKDMIYPSNISLKSSTMSYFPFSICIYDIGKISVKISIISCVRLFDVRADVTFDSIWKGLL